MEQQLAEEWIVDQLLVDPVLVLFAGQLILAQFLVAPLAPPSRALAGL